MGATGIIRKIDELGRLVLPMELRSMMGIHLGDSVGIFVEGDSVVLKKYEPGCVFCGESTTPDLITFRGKVVCPACARELLAGEHRKAETAVSKGTIWCID